MLATNLENEAACSIVQIYAQRMQIEECFRDAARTYERATLDALHRVCLRHVAGRCCGGTRLGEVASRQLTAPAHAIGVYGWQPRRQKPPSQPNSPAKRVQAAEAPARQVA